MKRLTRPSALTVLLACNVAFGQGMPPPPMPQVPQIPQMPQVPQIPQVPRPGIPAMRHHNLSCMRKPIASLAALAGMLGAAGVAGAADWSVDPRITLNADYDDNNRLTNVPGEEIEVIGAEVDAQVTFGAKTPRTDFRLVPRVRATFYPDEPDDETDSEFVTLNYDFRGQRYLGAFDIQWSRRETLGRYLPDDFDDDIGGDPGSGDDVGTSSDFNVQRRLSVAPQISFELTERSRLELGVGCLDVSFDEQVTDDRVDYTSASGNIAYRYLLSSDQVGGATCSGSKL